MDLQLPSKVTRNSHVERDFLTNIFGPDTEINGNN